ncbi:phytanoyl-CoA dioxygenase family protein [Microbacteriaceae bacterium K1510]|nr:phytanoyl-CoA dioxygenase family protein [Microbacteriaceae bacterium K1510]
MNGWSVIRHFINDDELAAIRESLHAAAAQPRPSCMSRPGNDLMLLRWSEPAVARILGAKSRMQRLSDELDAGGLRWLSAYISSKTPHSPPLWWHQDWWCWDHAISYRHATTQVAVLCYLTDTSADNGALRVLPGSHRRSMPMHAHLPEPHGEEANRLPLHHPAMADHPDQITVAVRAGDAVVLDYRLLHGTHANASPSPRDCVLLSFFPDWPRLPDELKAHCALHPALPTQEETLVAAASGYADLLPQFSGVPESLRVSRRAPAVFETVG